MNDRQLLWIIGGITAFLTVASLIGFVLARRIQTPQAKATIQNLNDRIRSWWIMVGLLGWP